MNAARDHGAVAPRLHRRAWLRGLLAGAVGVAAMAVLGGGSCHWEDDDWDDDFDDDFDDDDDDDVGTAVHAASAPTYRLADFDLVPGSGANAHPVAALREIRGLSLSAWEGSRELGAQDFADFAAKVLEYNDELIGLPAAAGRLELVTVDFAAEATVVRYAQVRGEAGAEHLVAGAELAFRFDLIGNLVAIENSTLLH